MLWFALTILTAAAALLLALPFLRTRESTSAEPFHGDIEAYKKQLASVSSDEAAGDIAPPDAQNLRVAIERRILDAAPDETAKKANTARLDRVSAIVVALIVVAGSATLYMATGSANTPDFSALSMSAPPSASAQNNAQNLPDVDTMIARLRSRLEASPNDADGWRMLGWSYFETDHYPEAVEAYRRALAIAPDNSGYKSALAEALTSANGDALTPEALSLFQQAHRADGSDERAIFYLALAKSQGGDVRGAISDWIAGVRAAAPDSQWAQRMRMEAEAAAQRINMNIAGRLPPASANADTFASAPASAPAIAQAAPEAQQQMIIGMVEGLESRLASNPRDAEGWVRLMRSRMVLGQPDRAANALQSALRAFADDPATTQNLRGAARELNVPGA